MHRYCCNVSAIGVRASVSNLKLFAGMVGSRCYRGIVGVAQILGVVGCRDGKPRSEFMGELGYCHGRVGLLQ